MKLEDLVAQLKELQEQKKKLEITYYQMIGQEALLTDFIQKLESEKN